MLLKCRLWGGVVKQIAVNAVDRTAVGSASHVLETVSDFANVKRSRSVCGFEWLVAKQLMLALVLITSWSNACHWQCRGNQVVHTVGHFACLSSLPKQKPKNLNKNRTCACDTLGVTTPSDSTT